jgi:hypothetical protein
VENNTRNAHVSDFMNLGRLPHFCTLPGGLYHTSYTIRGVANSSLVYSPVIITSTFDPIITPSRHSNEFSHARGPHPPREAFNFFPPSSSSECIAFALTYIVYSVSCIMYSVLSGMYALLSPSPRTRSPLCQPGRSRLYVWDVYGVCMGCVWDMLGYAWDMHGICMGYV